MVDAASTTFAGALGGLMRFPLRLVVPVAGARRRASSVAADLRLPGLRALCLPCR